MAGLPNGPTEHVVVAPDGDKNKIPTDGIAGEDDIDIADVVALIPVSLGSETIDEYIILSVSSPELGAGPGEMSEGRLSLRQHWISQPPADLSELIFDKGECSFFKGEGGDRKDPELSIIVSTKSGTCQAEAFFYHVVKDLLAAIGISESTYKVYFTNTERWISDFAAQTICSTANRGIAQSIILLSGDGGIVDILNGLYTGHQTRGYVKPRIGLIALGTGNALANSSGINTGNTKGLSTILHGSPRNIPTFICKCSPGSVLLVDEGRRTEELCVDKNGFGVIHGAVVASWCLHATLVADSDTAEYRKFGSERFSMVANELLSPSDGSPPHKWKGTITAHHRSASGEIESRVWDRKEHMYILATLVSNLEATLKISPESRPLDGQLRLVDFPPLPAADVKSIFGMAFNGGKHVQHGAVGYTPIEALRIDFEESDSNWQRICVDGKIIRIPEGGSVEIRLEHREVADLMVVG